MIRLHRWMRKHPAQALLLGIAMIFFGIYFHPHITFDLPDRPRPLPETAATTERSPAASPPRHSLS